MLHAEMDRLIYNRAGEEEWLKWLNAKNYLQDVG